MFELIFKYPRDLYARSELIYTGPWPEWLASALAVVALFAIGAFLYNRRRALSPLRLITIGAFQAAMVALALWLLAQPALKTEQLREGQNAIAVVLDTSASMAIDDNGRRIDVARRLLDGAVEASAPLNFAVQHYAFDENARELDAFDGLEPGGQATSIGESLRRILGDARREPLAALIVASDGADTSGGLDASLLAELGAFGVPIHSLAVGSATLANDLELENVVLPAEVLPDSQVSARVSIRHDGAAESQLKVYDGDNLLASVPVALDAGATSSSVTVDFELGAAGPHELEFSIDGVEGELEYGNNRRARLVDVIDDSYRVLYFEGEPRWEYKFMRRALTDDRDLRLESLLRVSPNKFYRQGIESAEQLADGFPTERSELFTYDALIIGSVEAASLTPDQLIMIRDFVAERGGTLLMLGGLHGLGNGGWGQTAVADALPARLPAIEVDSFRRVQVPVSLTPQGADSPILKFATDDDDNQRQWLSLPAVADYQLVGELKPAAVPLVNVTTAEGDSPLFLTQAYGRGRTYILATGGTWRWQMSLPVEDLRHERFWRQLMRSLVAGAPQATSLTTTSTPRGIDLRAEFRDEAFVPQTDIVVSAVVASESGQSYTVNLEPSAAEAGVFLGQVDPGVSGSYFAEAVAARDDEPVATARSSLSYETGQTEQFGIRADPGLLGRLSAATGGEALDEDSLGNLPDLLRFSTAGITEIETRAIWDAPAFFLLLLLLKAGEWLLRRRWGSI